MQKFIFFFCVILFVSCSTTSTETATNTSATTEVTETTPTVTKKGTVKNIGQEEFDRMNGDYGVFVIDVRTPAEINDGKIRGAIDLDISDPDFNGHLEKMDRNKSYIIYCKSGGRSAKASDIMIDMGFQNVFNLEGGYTAYKKNHPEL